MPNREAIKKGTEFEAKVSETLGLELTKASGNQWHDQSDARGRGIRASCKSHPVARITWAQVREELREAIDMAAGTGQTPLLALEDQDGSQLAILRLEDLAELLHAERGNAPVKRSERIRAAASTPLLRRQPDA